MASSDGIAPIWHNQPEIGGGSWKVGSTSRQRNSEDIASINSRSPHGIDIHQIGESGLIPSSNGGQSIHRLDHIAQIHGGQPIVGAIKASARQRDDQAEANLQNGGVGDGGGIGLLELVGGHEAGVDGVGNGGEGVGRAGLVAGGEGFADAVNAGARDGDFEEEGGRENVVLHIGVGDVDGVGEEEGDWVHREEGRHLRHFEVGVEGVPHHRIARVRV